MIHILSLPYRVYYTLARAGGNRRGNGGGTLGRPLRIRAFHFSGQGCVPDELLTTSSAGLGQQTGKTQRWQRWRRVLGFLGW